jgi:hypothetical protein
MCTSVFGKASRTTKSLCIVGGLVLGIGWGGYAEGQRANVNQQIRTLPPSTFKELPISFVERLNAKGCAIPQEAFLTPTTPNNVIQGEYANNGQTDWAALCSKAGKSSILVFWGKPTACSSEFAEEDDRNYLQADGHNQMVYSRQIRTVNEKKLKGSADRSVRGQINHEGIENSFVGKASSVFYCSDGKWKEIGGED